MPRLHQKFLQPTRRLILVFHLILLAGILVLWPVSHFALAGIRMDRNGFIYFVGIICGRLHVNNSWSGAPTYHGPRFMYWPVDGERFDEWSYFDWNKSRQTSDAPSTLGLSWSVSLNPNLRIRAAIPSSYLTILLSIYPALTYYRHRKRRHQNPAHAFPLEPQPSPTAPKPRD